MYYLTTDPSGQSINLALKRVVDIVGTVGGTAFTLAIMIIALVIIFGSISAAKMRTVWIALISCIAGAFIFYSAAWFSESIAGLGLKPEGTGTAIIQPVAKDYHQNELKYKL